MKAPLKPLTSSAVGAVRVKGPTAPDWNLDVGRPPETQAHCGPQVVRGSGLVLILGGVTRKLLLACSYLKLGISSVSLVGAQYSGV